MNRALCSLLPSGAPMPRGDRRQSTDAGIDEIGSRLSARSRSVRRARGSAFTSSFFRTTRTCEQSRSSNSSVCFDGSSADLSRSSGTEAMSTARTWSASSSPRTDASSPRTFRRTLRSSTRTREFGATRNARGWPTTLPRTRTTFVKRSSVNWTDCDAVRICWRPSFSIRSCRYGCENIRFPCRGQ